MPEPVWRFRDFGQAREVDTFAGLIRNQMNSVTHFSTVSHSQGGMASLHLYTHFWTGLDNSDAARPLQSVGTPYRGSNLMEDQIALSGLIAFFGFDDNLCGPVFDLTSFGAAIWLSGIPSASRDDVYFYRSRGQDLIPCFWSSPIIPGRDDGVVSVDEAYLSGGHDLGTTRKECHMTNMTHGSQLGNYGRNRTMASNARIWVPDPLEACLNVTQTSYFAPATGMLDASCSTVQSGSITSYKWQITGAQTHTLYGKTVSFPMYATGGYTVQLTVTSTGPTLTDTGTTFLYLSPSCNDPMGFCPEI